MKVINVIRMAVLVALVSFAACDKNDNCINGQGAVVTETLLVDNFNGIEFSIAGDVVITQGTKQEVTVTGEANIIDRIKTNVSGSIWKIGFEKGCYNRYDLTIHITVTDLKSIVLDGSGDIKVNDFTNQSNLSVSIPGSGNIILNQFDGTENLDVRISGNGSVICNSALTNLKGLDVEIAGAGNFDGYPAVADDCFVNIPGSGDCKVNVRNKLDIRINGTGSVFYKGNPSITQDINAAGHIVNSN